MVVSATKLAMAVRDWERVEDPPGQRAELVNGQVRMNPAPRPIHQHVVRLLTNALAEVCGADLLAVFDTEWRFPTADPEALYHARRPDIVVAAGASLRRMVALVEAPLIVVEVLSPGNRKPDIDAKRGLSFRHGASHYVDVSITDDERQAAITWHGRGAVDWTKAASAQGDETLEVRDPFTFRVRPNALLF